jgi:TetR/AcrR family transcriptional repressor of nem operon
MPYTPEHKRQSRERILESAAQCFLHQGYERTGIDEIMQHSGMTRGAFYAHFKNKSELYAKAMLHAASYGRFLQTQTTAEDDPARIERLIAGYLSREHLQDEKTPCPMAFLVTDVVSREPEVRQTYTRIYKRMNRIMGRYLQQHPPHGADSILAVTAMMIGGVALGRALDDPVFSERLLASCRQAATRLLASDQSE